MQVRHREVGEFGLGLVLALRLGQDNVRKTGHVGGAIHQRQADAGAEADGDELVADRVPTRQALPCAHSP